MNAKQILKNTGLEPREALFLLSFLIKKPREKILAHPEMNISPAHSKSFQLLIKKRLAAWPLAYLRGQQEFYNYNFLVNPHVLIPRPETELIVEEILTSASQDKLKNKKIIIDVGTGSGAIIISSALEFKKIDSSSFLKTSFYGLDISRAALNIARRNAKQYKLTKKIKFLTSNLLNNLPAISSKASIIIAANLPYLSLAQIRKSPSIQKEPRLALDGGADGLKYYRQLLRQVHELWKNQYPAITMILEIDPLQRTAIKKLSKKYWPQADLIIKKDLNQHDRLIVIKTS